ncbi:hypothetical protein [Spirosoma sordidisoli]|uniref:Uncharacterized protein n=1 Tax=Spirosoma sordidisoli TaxID=2502893 RepID=A0A4Q2UPH2_9BACT|nr:hypothetical protein [Spirosoma sordidisoli]RYC71256.1 hypothetical protein EQG79_03675 [Spirosoma sordidisoli]
MKTFLFVALLLAGCQPKNEQQSKVTINGKEYTDSVAVDSAGNQVKVKSDEGKADVSVSGSGNKVEIK